MANLQGNIKKLRTGEITGIVATYLCGAVLAFFVIGIAISSVQKLETLQLVTIIVSAVLMAIFATTAAVCSIKFGGALDKAIKKYILDVCVENAAKLHPERQSLSFYIESEGSTAELTVNGYKEKIIFDFTPIGRISFMRRAFIVSEIETRLCVTFCRLYNRGATYTDVGFAERKDKKKRKIDFIIKDGTPDKKAYRYYLKNKDI